MSSKIPPELTGKKGGQDSDYSDDNEAAPYNGFNNSISNRIKGLVRTLSRSSSINSTGTNASLYSFFNTLSKYANMVISKYLFRKESSRFDILKLLDGHLRPGELCVVLGKPGSGCSTFLKSISTQTYGFHFSHDTEINFNGLSAKEIHKHYRGDVIYCAETEKLFPHLSVGDTLKFAARIKTPQNNQKELPGMCMLNISPILSWPLVV